MTSWKEEACRKAEEQMIRQRAEGCYQIAQLQKLERSNKKKESSEEENRGGHCQEMSQKSIERRRKNSDAVYFHSSLQCTEINWEPNSLYNTRSFYGKGKGHPITGHQGPRRGVIILNFGARREWVVSTMPWLLYPQERPGTHCTGGWVGPGPIWTRAKNLAPTGIRTPDCPARRSFYGQLIITTRNFILV
jgi:hypothetical protein